MPKKEFKDFLPSESEFLVKSWLTEFSIFLKITRERQSKLGDFRPHHRGLRHQITVNGNLNPFAFLITLIHELAHAIVFDKYKRRVRPHGNEWKSEFRNRIKWFIENKIFPEDIENELIRYFKNPKASTSADQKLALCLMKYDVEKESNNNLVLLNEIDEGSKFCLSNGLILVKGEKRRTRFMCSDTANKRKYTVSAISLVKPV